MSNAASVVNITGNIFASNALSTTNLFATGNVVIGPSVTAINANLHVEQGSIFIGNSASFGTTQNTTSITQGRLIFDNTANISITPNKIVLYSNLGSAGNFCGFGVTGINPTTSTLAYYARNTHIFYVSPTNEVMRINSGSSVGIGTGTVNAKLHLGTASQNNVQFRVDSSNVAFATTLGGLVGINTLTPSANVHILGNVYASNSISTTNINFTSATLGPVVAGELAYNTYLYGTVNTTTGRGSVPVDYIFRLAASGSAYGPTITNFFGGTSLINLEATSVYDIESHCYFTKTMLGQLTWQIVASSAPTLISAYYTASPISGIASGAPITGYTGSQGSATADFAITSATLSTPVNLSFVFKTQVITNAATTLGLNVTQSAGQMTSLAGSYYRVTKLSTTTGVYS